MMDKFNELIERNYTATKRRGQINSQTNILDFIDKLKEELWELEISFMVSNINDPGIDEKELADLFLVVGTMAKHLQIDLFKIAEQKVEFNEKRED